MNNRKAKILRARAGGYVHPQERTYRAVNVRKLYDKLGVFERQTSTLICDRPEYRRYKAWKRLEKGVI